ncbi:ComEC/Rec2 family competence protein, partial [Patescibacteria group bacterium]|nr:ComEC/Rec2 family competence protein [Patescibacteria group bacterium]
MSKKIDESKKVFLISQWFLYLNLAFIFLVFLYGLLPGAFSARKLESEIAKHNGEKLSFKAFVCEEADLSYKSRRLTLCTGENGEAGKVLATTSLYPAYDYGDFLEVSGKLEAPEVFEGFDYPAYLARYDIYSLLYFPELKLSSGNLNFAQQAKRKLLDFKQGARLILNQNLPEPEAGLASAMLFGYKRTLEKEDLEIFSLVGLRHLMAISGAHITIISSLLMNFLIFLGFSRRRSFFPIISFLFLYPLITGLASSAIRSAIMGFFGFSALYFKRPKSSVRALVFSASLMLIFNPLLLSRDLGFQLSFL